MEEKEKVRKFGRGMGLLMSLTMSFFCSLLGNLTSGHFTVIGFIVSFAVSFVISLLIGFTFNKITGTQSGNSMIRASSAINHMFGREQGSVTKKSLAFTALISDLMYTPLLTLILAALGMTMTGVQIDKQTIQLEQHIAEVQMQITQSSADERTALLRSMTEMQQTREQILLAKPTLKKYPLAFLKSFAVCFTAGYFLIILFQPVYVNFLKKKYGLENDSFEGEV